VACLSKKSTIVISAEELNGKALKEASGRNRVANCVSDSNAEHGSSASVVEMSKAIEQISP
jgi:hypothetical protein